LRRTHRRDACPRYPAIGGGGDEPMSKGKAPDGHELLGEGARKPKYSFPPSLSEIPARRSLISARKRKVEEAMRALPLRDTATDVSPYVHAFEQTYYDVTRQKDNQPASAALLEKQLSEMIRKCDKLESHLKDMDRDAIKAWASAGRIYGSMDVTINFGHLVLMLNTAAEWAERALATLKSVRRAAKRGNPGDAVADRMRETADWLFTKLTSKRAGRAYDTLKGKEKKILSLSGFLGAYTQHMTLRPAHAPEPVRADELWATIRKNKIEFLSIIARSRCSLYPSLQAASRHNEDDE
jgi:hypothetical protein